ncbi:hypothetical protein F4825DRAFT_400961 [Nemania diffusa]|nr:hypothetical protein F4825DRAFT_400961 [Nemania diffusa]
MANSDSGDSFVLSEQLVSVVRLNDPGVVHKSGQLCVLCVKHHIGVPVQTISYVNLRILDGKDFGLILMHKVEGSCILKIV